MIRFYKSNNYAVLVSLPFLLLIIGGISIFSPNTSQTINQNSFISFLFNINELPSWLLKLFSYFIILSQAIIVNNISTSHEQIKGTYINSLIFIVLISSIPGVFSSPFELVSNFFVLLMFYNINSFSSETATINNIFSSGFFLSIATLFYTPTLIFLFIILISIWFFRTEYLKDFFISLSGFLIPFFFIFTYLFWFEQLDDFSNFILSSKIKWNIPILPEMKFFPLVFIFSLLFLISLFFIWRKSNSFNIITRRFMGLLVWFILIIIFPYILWSGASMQHFILFTIPTSIIISYYFALVKNSIRIELFFWLLLSSVIYQQFILLYPLIL